MEIVIIGVILGLFVGNIFVSKSKEKEQNHLMEVMYPEIIFSPGDEVKCKETGEVLIVMSNALYGVVNAMSKISYESPILYKFTWAYAPSQLELIITN